MRRLARYSLNALTALSLLLCVATVVFWLRSYDYADCLSVSRTRRYSLCSFDGSILLRRSWTVVTDLVGDDVHGTQPFISPYADHWVVEWTVGGIGLETHHSSGSIKVDWPEQRVRIPHGLLALPLAVLPFNRVAARPLRRRRRLARGLCPRCGYDLRATPDRCPECGTAKGAGCDATAGPAS